MEVCQNRWACRAMAQPLFRRDRILPCGFSFLLVADLAAVQHAMEMVLHGFLLPVSAGGIEVEKQRRVTAAPTECRSPGRFSGARLQRPVQTVCKHGPVWAAAARIPGTRALSAERHRRRSVRPVESTRTREVVFMGDTSVDQYSSGNRIVVAERSPSVMIQNFCSIGAVIGRQKAADHGAARHRSAAGPPGRHRPSHRPVWRDRARYRVPAGDLLQYAGRGHPDGRWKSSWVRMRCSYTVPPCSYVNDRKPLGVSTLKIILLVMVSLTSEPVWVPAALWRSSRSVRTTFTTRPLMIWGWSQSMRPLMRPDPPMSPICPMDRGQQGTLHAAVQGTACHHLGKAVGAPQLLFQLFFVELFSS